MNRIRFFIAILSCLFSGSLLAQYTPGNSQAANKILETASGNFAIFGSVGDSAAIFGIENCTNVVQFQNFVSSTGGESGFENAVEASNGDFWALGSCTNCAGADVSKKWLLARFQSSGFLIGTQSLGTPNVNCEGNAIASTTTGGMILGGFFEEVPSLILLDASGATLWTQSYPFATADTIGYIHDVIQTPDGGFAFVGWERNILTNQQWLMTGKTDANGVLEWRTKYANNANFPNEARAVQMRANGNLAVAGTIYVNTTLKQDIFVFNVDIADGTNYQGPTFGGAYNDIARDLQPNPDGSWLMACSKENDPNISTSDLAHFIRTTANFIQTNVFNYSLAPFDFHPNSIVPLASNGTEFAVASTLKIGYWTEADFLRTNETVCGDTAHFILQSKPGGGIIITPDDVEDLLAMPSSNCSTVISPGNDDELADCILDWVTFVEIPENELSIYPNPVSDNLHIETPFTDVSVKIQTLQGTILYQGKVVNAPIYVGDYPQGLYSIEIQVGMEKIRKLIVIE